MSEATTPEILAGSGVASRGRYVAQAHARVIVKILPNAGAVESYWNTYFAQVISWPDP